MNNKLKISNFKFQIKKERVVALGVFVVLGFASLQLPINNLAGSGAKFTLFDLFAPVSGAFLGSWIGILAVFLMQIASLSFHGFSNLDRGVVIRLFPILFGVWFFSKRSPNLLIIPALAIISFNLNPVGRSVWYYSLFWTIPFLVYPIAKKSIVARSLASTFIAHSAGGAVWIWVFSLPAAVWRGLIPVVALERSIMALGICASFILMSNVVAFLRNKKLLKTGLRLDNKYIFNK